MNEATEHRALRLIDLKEVVARTTLSAAVIWERIKERTFPAPIGIGKPYKSGRQSRVAWLESEIDEWIMQQVQRARGI